MRTPSPVRSGQIKLSDLQPDRGQQSRLCHHAGFNYWGESQAAFGARCNHDDVDGAVCGAPGFIEVPLHEGIRNEPNWASLRLGAEAR
jgi:hypothetical protein